MAAVSWGLAVDRRGRVLVTLRDGRAVCFGPQGYHYRATLCSIAVWRAAEE